MNLKTLRNDLFGGITAGVVALPLALAFGVQSGLGAIAGLYGAIILGFFASLLGGTHVQVSGPTGPMTVISAVIVANAISHFGGLEQGYPFIIATFFLAGLIQIILGFSRIGQVVRYIPYPVVSGFMSGIGVLIIILQIFPLLGHESPTEVLDIFSAVPGVVADINWQAAGLGLATIVMVYLFPKCVRIIPSLLLALIVATIVSAVFKFSVPLINHIPSGLPKFQGGHLFQYHFEDLKLILIASFTLAALGSLDSLLTAVIADNITKTKHNSNRELIGQGVGNTLAALFGGIPGAGATMRTMVNIKAGGQTRLSGMVHSVLLLCILLGLGKYADDIPLSVLAGILITVGISIIDYKGLRHLFHVPRTDALIMLTVLGLTVFVDLLQAVAAGMVLASVLFMKKMSDIAEEKSSVGPLKAFEKELPWGDNILLPPQLINQIYVKHLDTPLFFGFISQFRDLVEQIPDVKLVIIRMKRVPYIDQSGLYAIEEAVYYLQSKGVKVLLTGVHGQVRAMFKNIKIIPNLIPEENVFTDFHDCVEWLRTDYDQSG